MIQESFQAGGVPKPPGRPPDEPIIIKTPPKPTEAPELEEPEDGEDISPPPRKMPPPAPERRVMRRET